MINFDENIMTSALISVQDVGLTLPREKKVIVEHISFDILPNTVTTIIGPNGGGKSTILKILLGLVQPTAGKVVMRPEKPVRIGYLPQRVNCDRSFPISVEHLLKTCPNYNAETYAWLIENCDLESILSTSIHALSGGERQRAFLARALMGSPELLVLDEPAQGTDIKRQAYLYRLLAIIRKKFNCAILLVSHDLMLVMRNTDRVICLDQCIHCQGKPLNVVSHPEFSNIFGPVIAQNLQDAFAYYPHQDHHDDDCGCPSTHAHELSHTGEVFK